MPESQSALGAQDEYMIPIEVSSALVKKGFPARLLPVAKRVVHHEMHRERALDHADSGGALASTHLHNMRADVPNIMAVAESINSTRCNHLQRERGKCPT